MWNLRNQTSKGEKKKGERDKPRNFFFLKILFIYATEIETASERGNTEGGVGEKEAGS